MVLSVLRAVLRKCVPEEFRNQCGKRGGILLALPQIQILFGFPAGRKNSGQFSI